MNDTELYLTALKNDLGSLLTEAYAKLAEAKVMNHRLNEEYNRVAQELQEYKNREMEQKTVEEDMAKHRDS